MKDDLRTLTFTNFDEVLAEVERLRVGGYDQRGSWNLSQMCRHLAMWFVYPMDGYPIGKMPWILRATLGKMMLKKWLKQGHMGRGGRTLKQTVPPADLKDESGIEELKTAIARWTSFTGTLHASPLFGSQDRPVWDKLMLVHCAHHLRFLTPKA